MPKTLPHLTRSKRSWRTPSCLQRSKLRSASFSWRPLSTGPTLRHRELAPLLEGQTQGSLGDVGRRLLSHRSYSSMPLGNPGAQVRLRCRSRCRAYSRPYCENAGWGASSAFRVQKRVCDGRFVEARDARSRSMHGPRCHLRFKTHGVGSS